MARPVSERNAIGSAGSRRSGQAAFSANDWALARQELRLSEREVDIVRLVFDDRCDEGIAAELGISKHTVNTHLVRLYRKLDVHSRVQLVVRICAVLMQGQAVASNNALSLEQATLE